MRVLPGVLSSRADPFRCLSPVARSLLMLPSWAVRGFRQTLYAYRGCPRFTLFRISLCWNVGPLPSLSIRHPRPSAGAGDVGTHGHVSVAVFLNKQAAFIPGVFPRILLKLRQDRTSNLLIVPRPKWAWFLGWPSPLAESYGTR